MMYRCRMCGGKLEITNGVNIAECPYCNTVQTIPKLDDERRINLYDRANHFRRNNEYDKAMAIYEQILNEEPNDEEAYWSIVLCRYGIEYVEDTHTHKRVPTINRLQYTSIYMDEDYKSAIQHANSEQKTVYEQEAAVIDEIQRGILSISEKEEPFDVFICYKETDESGRRTPDSVLAYDLYHQLTKEGFKTFFARVTLEDKLGSAYEPYIFAALNSAKVMIVLGTKPEFFQAVWVKNEWSRYLALIKNGADKTLVPAYKDMDPYDLPEEFSHLQAQDMSKLGFMQDLLRGIKKIIQFNYNGNDRISQEVQNPQSVSSQNVSPLIERIFMFLEDGEWDNAGKYCEKVLDIEPKNPEAYLGRLMVDLKAKTESDLENCNRKFDQNSNYQKALRFGSESLRSNLENYSNQTAYNIALKEMNEAKTSEDYLNAKNLFEELGSFSDAKLKADNCQQAAYEVIYKSALNQMQLAVNEVEFKNAARTFETIPMYKDSAEKIKQCLEKAEYYRNDTIYNNAIAEIEQINNANIINDDSFKLKKLTYIKELLSTIPEHRDAESKLQTINESIDKIKAKQELIMQMKIKKYKRKKRIQLLLILLICLYCLFAVCRSVIISNFKYEDALKKMESGNYDEAYASLTKLGNYKDASDQALLCKYSQALDLFNNQEYESAYDIFIFLGDYKDAPNHALLCKYSQAVDLFINQEYESAYDIFNFLDINYNFNNSSYQAICCNYELAKHYFELGDYVKVHDILNNALSDAAGELKPSIDDLLISAEMNNINNLIKSFNEEKDAVFSVVFGTYELDGNLSNGKESMDWIILDAEEDRVLLLSKYCIDIQKFNTKYINDWGVSTLRSWLNNEFIETAFSENERNQILLTCTSEQTDGENLQNVSLTDNVFLLSVSEYEKYVKNKEPIGTSLINMSNVKTCNGWWLRSPFTESDISSHCCYISFTDYSVCAAISPHLYAAVRPALWLSLQYE